MMKELLKNNIKVIIAFVLGLIVSGAIGVYAFNIAASDVSYDNSTSGLEADNVKDALDNLYGKAGNDLLSPGKLLETTSGRLVDLPIDWDHRVGSSKTPLIIRTSDVTHIYGVVQGSAQYPSHNPYEIRYTYIDDGVPIGWTTSASGGMDVDQSYDYIIIYTPSEPSWAAAVYFDLS